MPARNTPERFWARVKIGEPNECWEWQGTLNKDGYGNAKYGGKGRAHRIAFFSGK